MKCIHRPLFTTVTLFLIFLVSVGAIVWALKTQNTTFDPLNYPLQHVTSVVDAADGPSVHAGDPVMVTAIKCNNFHSPVDVIGQLYWVEVDPKLPPIPDPNAAKVAQRQPGCTTIYYTNVPPPNVVALMSPGSIWRIMGVEHPTAPHSATTPWTTDNFVIAR